MSFTYLLINLSYYRRTARLSRDRQIAYYRNFPALTVATIIVSALYIVWVCSPRRRAIEFQSQLCHWFRIQDFPVEEICFFVTVPYAACLCMK